MKKKRVKITFENVNEGNYQKIPAKDIAETNARVKEEMKKLGKKDIKIDSELEVMFLNKNISLLAKKKGFDEQCLAHWEDNKLAPPAKLIINYTNITNGKWGKQMQLRPNLFKIHNKNSTLPQWAVAAPTHQQLVDWFRIEHKIQVRVVAFDLRSKVMWHYECQDLTLVKTEHSKDLVFKFKTPSFNISKDYYKSLEKGIKEAFKLIK